MRVRLRRGHDAEGRVTVDPQLEFHTPAWDDQLLEDFGGDAVSVESSVAIAGNTAYFANSAGLVQGWDIGALDRGAAPTRTLRFWTGDDTDASVVTVAAALGYASQTAFAAAFRKLTGETPSDWRRRVR